MTIILSRFSLIDFDEFVRFLDKKWVLTLGYTSRLTYLNFPVLKDEGQSIMDPNAEEYSNVSNDHQNAEKTLPEIFDFIIHYDYTDKSGYAINRGNYKPNNGTNDGILSSFNHSVHLSRLLTRQDNESESGTDQDSIFDSTGSLKSEDTSTSIDNGACSEIWQRSSSNDNGACSKTWQCCPCNCDHCIDEAISRLKMDREDCLQNIELWEKALHIIGWKPNIGTFI